jgi:regulatory protein
MAGRRSTRARSGRGWDAAPPRDGDAAPSQPRAGRRSREADQPGGERDARPVDPAERAREICLRQLAVRPRTRAELAGALKQRGIADDVAASVLDRYGEVGIIDDRAFARAWVTSRHHGRGLAKKALATELRRKGVEPETVGAALAELGDDAEAATARALVDRKLRSTPSGDPSAAARRLVGMLARKGYAPGLAFRVVRQAMADQADEVEEDLDAALQEALEAGLDPRPDEG